MFYSQSTGIFTWADHSILGRGYAGNGEGKNNPNMQNVENIGPLPRGKYTISKHYDSFHTGPFTLPLTPDPSNEMFGREAFKIHGDSITDPGTASNGCIVLPRDKRELIDQSTDKELIVTE
jgi:hypothetical protein